MSLWKYKYFVDVVEGKSFTKAGKKNFVTQTAVSQQIASLEKSIGGKLLDRGNGEFVVTELGQIVYNRAKEMLEIHEQMQREIDQLKEKYVIRIGIDSSMNRLIWVKTQEMVERYYSDEEFHFSKIDLTAASRLFEEDALDIFIGYGFAEDYKTEIEELEICSNPVGVYLGEHTTVRNVSELTMDDLEGHVRYGTLLYPCSMRGDFQQQNGQNYVQIKQVDTTDILKLRVEVDDGYALADSRYFSYQEDMLPILVDCEMPCIMKAFYRKNHDKKIVQVLECLRHIMGNES